MICSSASSSYAHVDTDTVFLNMYSFVQADQWILKSHILSLAFSLLTITRVQGWESSLQFVADSNQPVYY